MSGKSDRRSTGNIPFILTLFSLSAFGLLAFRDPSGFDKDTALLGVLVSAMILFQFYFLYYVFRGMDEILLLMVDTLAILGFVILQRLTPTLALRQAEWFAAGNIVLFLAMLVIPHIRKPGWLLTPLMVLGPAIVFLVAFFGEKSGGATSKLPIGDFSIQPAEFAKVIFIVVLAYSLEEMQTFRQRIPALLFAMFSILGVAMQKDLGGALHYFLVFLFMYYIATSDWLVTAAAAGAGIAASVIGYHLFSHVQVRVEAWKNPWADVGGKGYQVAQSLMAMGSGGWFGMGLNLGEPYAIPASRTDFIFAAICEEFGILVGGMVIGLYILILIRSMQKALHAHRASDTLLASGASISLAIQAFIIIGGVIKMIPLTGITLPFVSYGGSSMIVSLSMVGIVEGVSVRNDRTAREEGQGDGTDEEKSDEDEDT